MLRHGLRFCIRNDGEINGTIKRFIFLLRKAAKARYNGLYLAFANKMKEELSEAFSRPKGEKERV